jgi:hypothetical protein
MAGNAHTIGRIPALLTCAVAAMMAVTIGSGPALAADTQLPYREQARAAGLTSAQAMELQARVDGYLTKAGGVQTAANRIEYSTGAILLVTLPTEKAARDLSAAPASAAAMGCEYQWLCLYEFAEYSGDSLKLYYCNSWQGVPWRTEGSWTNNQTWGTSWAIRDEYGRVAFWYPAFSYMHNGQNWTPIVQAKAC